MAISKKIIKDNEKVMVITTEYSDTFHKNINRAGRRKKDYRLLNEERLKEAIRHKIKNLKKYNKVLDCIEVSNSFNCFLTVRGINKNKMKKIFDCLRKKDNRLEYIRLAAWSIESDLHYHILLNSSLSIKEIEEKLRGIDYDLQDIYDTKKLFKYLKKNINFDVIHILKQLDNNDLREKQIEILEYSNILSFSKGINTKPEDTEVIKNPTEEQLSEVYKGDKYRYMETVEYDKLDSSIQIDKFEIVKVSA